VVTKERHLAQQGASRWFSDNDSRKVGNAESGHEAVLGPEKERENSAEERYL